MAGRGERLVRRFAVVPADQCGDVLLSEVPRAQDVRGTFDDTLDRRMSGKVVAVADGTHQHDRQVGQPSAQVTQPLEAGQVRPLQFIDDDQHGLVAGHVLDE